MNIRRLYLSFVAALSAGLVSAHEAESPHAGGWTSARPDGHAPIGVMGDDMHHKAEWMLSYRFMYMDMDMDGMRDGTNNLSSQDVFSEGYMVSPTAMTMEMHMFGSMYARSDSITVMAMVPFSRKTMDLETRSGTRFSTESSGLNDISITGLFRIANRERQSLDSARGRLT